MKFKEFKDRKILILGFGSEGQSTLRWLRKYYPTMLIGLADMNGVEKMSEAAQEQIAGDGNLILHLGENYLDSLVNYEVIIRTPGINPRLYGIEKALEKGATLTSASRIFFDNAEGFKIAVTGSKGKSTTASLIYEILKAAGKNVYLVGNIGTPGLDVLPNSAEDYLVVEMSSYQLEDFRAKPNIGVFVSFFPEHLDYHKSVENYFEAKTHLFQSLTACNYMVYNGNNKVIAAFAEKVAAQKIDFMNSPELDLAEQIRDKHSKMIDLGGGLILDKSKIKLLGSHNLENMVCAASVAKIVQIDNSTIKEVLENFRGLKHRLEWLGEYRGVDFYDDAISTTPESTIAALDALDGKVGTLILGGLDRGYDFSKLGEKILKHKIENLILFPGSGEAIWQAVMAAVDKLGEYPVPKAIRVSEMKSAVEKAYKCTKPKMACLLSTASPSYNMFKNFEEKGDKFAYYVKQLS